MMSWEMRAVDRLRRIAEEMARRYLDLEEFGRAERPERDLIFLRLQFRDEAPKRANLRIEILEYDASRAVGWKISDWAMAVRSIRTEKGYDYRFYQIGDGSP